MSPRRSTRGLVLVMLRRTDFESKEVFLWHNNFTCFITTRKENVHRTPLYLYPIIQLPQVRKPAFYLHYLHLTPSQLTFVEIYLAPDQQKLTFVEIYLAPDYKKLTLVIHESHDKRGEPSQKNPKAWDKSGEPPRDDGELRFFHGEPPHEQVQEVQQKQPL